MNYFCSACRRRCEGEVSKDQEWIECEYCGEVLVPNCPDAA